MRIALVVLDSLRRDSFDERFDWLPGCRFDAAWSPSNWTMPAHASMFTGLYPTEHGAHHESEYLDYPEVLPEALSAAGYRTRAFSANTYASPAFGFGRGFDEFTGPFLLKPVLPGYFNFREYGGRTGSRLLDYSLALRDLLLSDAATLPSLRIAVLNRLQGIGVWTPKQKGVSNALRWVERLELADDEFLFFNFMETHTPYHYIPDSYRNEVTDPSVPEGESPEMYAGAVSFLSDAYRRLFRRLEEEMDYVFTLSDHGECLGEDGVWGHGQGSGLYPEITRVPLVISGRNVPEGPVETPVDLLDIHRTLCDLCGVDASGRGRNLLGELEPRELLQETYEFRDSDAVSDPPTMCRGLVTRSGAHVFETADGLVNPDGVPDAAERIRAAVDGLDRRASPDRRRGEVSPEVERQLERLGYR